MKTAKAPYWECMLLSGLLHDLGLLEFFIHPVGNFVKEIYYQEKDKSHTNATKDGERLNGTFFCHSETTRF